MYLSSRRIIFFISAIFLLCSNGLLLAQVKIVSWNLQNLGKSKSAEEIAFMANTLREFDVIALQEVIAGYGGAQAVARLAGELNRTGAKWNFVVSNPTQSSSPQAAERYAFLWKTSKVTKLKEAWLDPHFVVEIDREPYLANFSYDGKVFTLVNYHAIPKKKQPETEIKYFKFLPAKYPGSNLIFLGDFNLPQHHTVFNPLKKIGFRLVFIGQKTTMKMECIGEECLASEYDNIIYNSTTMSLLDYGVVLFYESFPDMKSARRISDHIPIWVELNLTGDG